MYCDFAFDVTTKRLKSKLQIRQNCALYVVKMCDLTESITKIRNDLNIDSIQTSMMTNCCKVVSKVFHDLGSLGLNSLLERTPFI